MNISLTSDNIWQDNASVVRANMYCQAAIQEVQELGHFIENLGYLFFSRTITINGNKTFSPRVVINSLTLTTFNIAHCLEGASIADAKMLLRKYEDDLFFYAYIMIFSMASYEAGTTKQEVSQESIRHWLEGEPTGLDIKTMYLEFEQLPRFKDMMQKYKIGQLFKRIRGGSKQLYPLQWTAILQSFA